jgi:hypothetical protein
VAPEPQGDDMTDVPRTDLAAILHGEWQWLSARPEPIAHARRWGMRGVVFEDLDDLLSQSGFDGCERRPSARRANAVLGGLVRIARTDQLAGRIILQRMLPGLLTACRRWRRGCSAACVSPDELLGELVAVAWIVIGSYSTARRPRNVANNLVSDTVYRAFVAPSRRKCASEDARDPEHFGAVPASDAEASMLELAEVVRDARQAGVDARHVTLLCDLLRADGSAERVAAQRRVSGRTIRTQRARAIARVRAVALSSAA